MPPGVFGHLEVFINELRLWESRGQKSEDRDQNIEIGDQRPDTGDRDQMPNCPICLLFSDFCLLVLYIYHP
jgi:hypothetical protein